MLAACDSGLLPERGSPEEAGLQVLRIRPEVQRNRLWLLDHAAVSVYDNTTGRLIRRVQLPGWIFVLRQFSCPPDLAIDPSGSAMVSSNVLPVLWRIDGERFEVTQLELALDADMDKDVGFSGLAFASDGTLFAESGILGSLWQIDVRASSAKKLASSAPAGSACEPGTLLRAASGGFPQPLAESKPAS
jgi:hypothetical protein